LGPSPKEEYWNALKTKHIAGCKRLTPVILAIPEAEIRRIAVRSQPRQIVHETLPQENPSQKRAGEVAQSVGSEFKPQYRKKKKKDTNGVMY
jgi:hypothetical protein